MRSIVIMAGFLVLTASGAFAQDTQPAARAAAPAARANTAPANANAIRPGSMETPHGANGFGAAYPVPGLYRENPGNGLYGAYTGSYEGQL